MSLRSTYRSVFPAVGPVIVMLTLAFGPRPVLADPPAEQASADATSTTPRPQPEAPERRWIKHKIVPKESLDDIAKRYGVTREALVRWNKSLRNKEYIYAGQTLRVYARRVPPPRRKISYIVQFGDTWQEIAGKYNVREGDLRYWNKKVPRNFRAGTKLTVYTDPVEPPARPAWAAAPGEETPLTDLTFDLDVGQGGISVGKPNRGRLIGGVPLPKSDLYTVRDPEKTYGSTHAVEIVVRSIADFRQQSGFDGDLVIGAMSRREGGRFRPHKSHQSGRDIDIRLPKHPSPGGDNVIDWRAAWHLVKAFAESGEVEYIFLEYSRQRMLYRAAKAEGATRQELERLLQFPRGPNTNHGLVRHARGHTMHVHIRIKCSRGNGRCQSY